MSGGSDAAFGADELVLIAQAQEGDATAFGILYVRHLEAIYRYIFFRVSEQAEAEDLTEEVFVRAWEMLPGYQPGLHPFKSWLYRIAHNLVVDHHRKRRPQPLEDDSLHLIPSPAPGPEEALAHEQSLQALRYALRMLDEEEQQVIVLRFVEELSHSEIARIIGKTDGASRVIQHRALSKLQRFLVERGSENE